MDKKVLEEIQTHQKTVTHDSSSPLQIIRDKELEIAGKVLAAKKQAEEIVADARRKAVDVVAKADTEGEGRAEQTEQKLMKEAGGEALAVGDSADEEIARLKDTIAARTDKAVGYLVKAVTRT